MSLAEQGHHQQVDDFFFAHNYLAGILANGASGFLNLADFIGLRHGISLSSVSEWV